MRSISILLPLALLFIAGCGGGGNSGSSPVSRSKVLELLMSGMSNSSQIRDDGGSRKPKTRSHEDGLGDFWYDDFLELWVEMKEGLNDAPLEPSGELYFVDHDKTQPAGHDLIWVSDPSVYPIVVRTERIFTAGTLAGEEERDEFRSNADDSGSSSGSGKVPGQGTYSYSGAWSPAGLGTWTMRFDYSDRTWQEYKYESTDDLGMALTIRTSQGVTFFLRFLEDRSGSGRIEGAGDGLPATIAWDSDGEGFVSWRDGTTTPVNVYDL